MVKKQLGMTCKVFFYLHLTVLMKELKATQKEKKALLRTVTDVLSEVRLRTSGTSGRR